jgi:hypothetical protein
MKTTVARTMLPLLLAMSWACSAVTVADSRPTAVDLTASPTAAPVNQAVHFSYTASGVALSGLLLEYGDGTADTVDLGGSQTASGTLPHSYTDGGTFTARATLNDVGFGVVADSVEVTITAAGR